MKKYAPKLTGKILDFGCGAMPYKTLFINATQYIGVDIENPRLDHNDKDLVIYDGERLPFADNEFDCVFSTQVLEHVPNFHLSFSEITRVIKPNGHILLSVPFCFPEHSIPFDYRRFSIYEIKKTLEEFNFEIIEIEKLGSFTEVIAQLKALYWMDQLKLKKGNKVFCKIWHFAIYKPIIALIVITGVIKNIIFPKNTKLYFNTMTFAKSKKLFVQ
jgi:SAM-dependent methyltransferase